MGSGLWRGDIPCDQSQDTTCVPSLQSAFITAECWQSGSDTEGNVWGFLSSAISPWHRHAEWPPSMSHVPVAEGFWSMLRFSLFSESGHNSVASSETVPSASEELAGAHPLPAGRESFWRSTLKLCAVLRASLTDQDCAHTSERQSGKENLENILNIWSWLGLCQNQAHSPQLHLCPRQPFLNGYWEANKNGRGWLEAWRDLSYKIRAVWKW